MRTCAIAGVLTLIAAGSPAGPGVLLGQSDTTPDLGTVAFPISCSAPAQRAFHRAMALWHHMTYPQAWRAFADLAEREPDCAMAHWGVAMTLFQPLWPTRPDLADRRRGWEAAERAAHAAPPTTRERLYIDAALAFFRDPASDDYWARIARWDVAVNRLYRAFPNDPEVRTMRALALLATAPQDRVDRSHADEAAELLLAVLRHNPRHPGAMHYLIHANDMPEREGLQLPVVASYDRVAPENPHALHMPTHIYTRLGEWGPVIAGNQRAATAALAHPAGERREWVWDEFPHAIEYLVYAHLQRGDDSAAALEVTRLLRTDNLQPSFKTAFHLASTPVRYALERGAWEEATRLSLPAREGLNWDRFAWPEAIVRFATGLAALHLGEPAMADSALARLAALEARTALTGEGIFARNITILRLELRGWARYAAGHAEEAIALMREAVALEHATPKHAVTPAPTIPAEELLGEILLAEHRPGEALDAYRAALGEYPRRFNAIAGAARAARQSGDTVAARACYQALLDLAAPGASRAVLIEAREFLSPER